MLNRRRSLVVLGVLVTLFVISSHALRGQAGSINGHPTRLDATNLLLAWLPDQSTAYDQVLAMNTQFLTTGVPDGSNGLKLYLAYSYTNPDTLVPANWPHNPAGVYAMLTDSALAYSAYSGNPAMMAVVGTALTYHLDNGMTPSTYDWPNVAFASSDAGATTYQGARFGDVEGRGDGFNVLEPDKIGEISLAFLKYYEYSGIVRFRDAAVQAGDALASHVRTGDATHSPWPYRVFATNNLVREEYTAHVIAPIKLFDELIRLNLGNVAAYQAARQTAWTWLVTFPLTNNVWANYFEDVPIAPDLTNTNQLVAGETARYLLLHHEADPNWLPKVRGIIAWIEQEFGVTESAAMTIREQKGFWFPMGSHTSRYASINAMLAEQTGDAAAKEKAFRSFNWATYMCRTDSRTIDGPDVNNMWWTDGYGDYVKHFMAGMGAVPEWAPPGRTHLLRSSSVVKSVLYAPTDVTYVTFDGSAQEVLRLGFTPQSVTANGLLLPLRADLAVQGWTYSSATGVMRVRHDAGTQVRVSASAQSGNQPPAAAVTSPASGAGFTAPASIVLSASASDADGSVTSVDFLANGFVIGSDTTLPYTFTWGSVPAGAYRFTAAATDNQGARTVSPEVPVTVSGVSGNVAPTVSITSPASNTTFVTPVTITVNVTAADANGNLAQVDLLQNGVVLSSKTVGPFTFTLAGVLVGDYVFTARATDTATAATTSAPVNVKVIAANAVPPPWVGGDVGSVGVAGSATLAGGIFTLKGSGIDIWDSADSFYFLSQPFNGDGEIRARVTAEQNTDPWALAGVMIRETLAAGSREAIAALSPAHGLSFTWRAATPGLSSYMPGNLLTTAPVWVRLVRQGTAIRAYSSSDGATWTQYGTATVSMTASVLAGLAVTARNNTVLNTSTFDQVSVTQGPDSTPPTAPSNLSATQIAATRVDLAWTAATDNVGVASYNVKRGGAIAGSSTTTTYADTGVTQGTPYTYLVEAKDGAGNIGPASNPLVLATPDTQAPTVSLTAPASGATVQGTIAVSASASDNIAVSNVVFQVDGSPIGSPDTAAPYSVSWNTTGVASGPHTLTAIARDAAGNATTSASRSVTVSNGPPDVLSPTVNITAPSAGATVSGSITVSANASDNVGVAGVQFLLDNAVLGAEVSSAPYQVTWNSTTSTNGAHTISAWARDAAGHVTQAAGVAVTVAQGLVMALSFDENTGTAVADSSGTGNGGTLSGTTWTPGKFGSGLVFNGTSSRVTVADSNALDLTADMTLEAWVRPAALSNWPTVILKERTGGLAYGLYASDGTNRPPSGYVYVSGDKSALGTALLPLNTWSHLALTYNGSTMILYVNGVQVASRSQTGSTAVSTGALSIGSNTVWGEYFNGAIDEVRLYNRALSQAQIQTDMTTRIKP